jgi:serine/threonine protein kinase
MFDFGLAKELTDDRKTDREGYYRMTGMTGGIRYMAPEVGLNKPYNNKVDVYSWSMVFWYMLALEPPFGMYTNNMFVDRVFQKKYRPAINDRWPNEYGDLLRKCWSHRICDRPSFIEISSTLREEIHKLDPTMSVENDNDKEISTWDTAPEMSTLDITDWNKAVLDE